MNAFFSVLELLRLTTVNALKQSKSNPKNKSNNTVFALTTTIQFAVKTVRHIQTSVFWNAMESKQLIKGIVATIGQEFCL